MSSSPSALGFFGFSHSAANSSRPPTTNAYITFFGANSDLMKSWKARPSTTAGIIANRMCPSFSWPLVLPSCSTGLPPKWMPIKPNSRRQNITTTADRPQLDNDFKGFGFVAGKAQPLADDDHMPGGRNRQKFG